MRRICIIPARGGSKRIPRKNIRDFFGKPVIAYAIQTALEAGVFDKVFVSTDDEEIAALAKRWGASVDFLRSAEASSDSASTLDVLQEVVARHDEWGEHFEELLCLYPVTPLVSAAQIVNGLRSLEASQHAMVFPVVAFGHPIWRAFREEGKEAIRIWPEYSQKRTQDLPQAFHDAGQWYWLRVTDLRRVASLDELTFVHLVSEDYLVQDVDTENDWIMLELKFQWKQRNG
jgi:pseudaminic acid cytidylyltransferase